MEAASRLNFVFWLSHSITKAGCCADSQENLARSARLTWHEVASLCADEALGGPASLHGKDAGASIMTNCRWNG